MDKEAELALRMEGIFKEFPGVIANNNIDFELRIGEVHGLLGENGAGKTTLMNLLYGLHQPDAGTIYLGGRKVRVRNPSEASMLGIGMVHQQFMLLGNLSALENVILGLRSSRPPFLDIASASERFKRLASEYDVKIEPTTPVWQLAVGEQQWLEILKQLYRNARILILDEPTSVLAPSEALKLFRTIRHLADEGRSVVFISHKLGEVREVTDRITVLRDGHVVGTVNTRDAVPSALGRMMVGRDVLDVRKPRPSLGNKEDVLVIEDLCCNNDRGLQALHNLNLTVQSGEIVGVAGVDGNGQRELAEAIVGLRKVTKGIIRIGESVVSDVVNATDILGYVPEDRRKTGLVMNFSVEENLAIKTFHEPPITRWGIMHWEVIRKRAESIIKEYSVKTPDPTTPVRNLSGGNQQKVVVGRELSGKPLLLVTSQPTRGLDLGAVDDVHEVLLRERNRGAAVLFISTELPEVLALSDRVVVLFKGAIMGDIDAAAVDVDHIGEMMLGHARMEATKV